MLKPLLLITYGYRCMDHLLFTENFTVFFWCSASFSDNLWFCCMGSLYFTDHLRFLLYAQSVLLIIYGCYCMDSLFFTNNFTVFACWPAFFTYNLWFRFCTASFTDNFWFSIYVLSPLLNIIGYHCIDSLVFTDSLRSSLYAQSLFLVI